MSRHELRMKGKTRRNLRFAEMDTDDVGDIHMINTDPTDHTLATYEENEQPLIEEQYQHHGAYQPEQIQNPLVRTASQANLPERHNMDNSDNNNNFALSTQTSRASTGNEAASQVTPITPHIAQRRIHQETGTYQCPSDFWLSANKLEWDGGYLTLRLRMNSPVGPAVEVEPTAQTAGNATTNKISYTQCAVQHVTNQPGALIPYPWTYHWANNLAENWKYLQTIYEQYTVIKCDYEIQFRANGYIGTVGSNPEVMIEHYYDAYATTAQVEPYKTTSEAYHSSHQKTFNAQAQNDLNSTVNRHLSTIKGTWTPSTKQLNIRNEADAKVWTSTAVVPVNNYCEWLTLNIHKSPWYKGSSTSGTTTQQLGCDMHIKLNWHVQCKDLKPGARYEQSYSYTANNILLGTVDYIARR